jgi:hypothetical protein
MSMTVLASDLVNMPLPDLLAWLTCRRKNGALDRDVLGMARDLAAKCNHPTRRRIFANELRRLTKPTARRKANQNNNTPYWKR